MTDGTWDLDNWDAALWAPSAGGVYDVDSWDAAQWT